MPLPPHAPPQVKWSMHLRSGSAHMTAVPSDITTAEEEEEEGGVDNDPLKAGDA